MKKKIVYLAGPIDSVSDRGIGWRREFASALIEIGVETILPNDIECKLDLCQLKTKSLDDFKKAFRQNVILPDLAAMDFCDAVVVRWDGEFIAGTAHECGRAFMRKQPVMLVTPRSFIEVPNWLLACCSVEFHTLDELVEYLRTTDFEKVSK